ncbi:MAG: hypothetical protein HYV51_02195 [Parcubacteria group bacterium]|nr:hypothetical protein [Parcubacteria group bacterium]
MNIKAKVILIILVIAVISALGVYLSFKKFYFTPAKNVEEPTEETKLPAENFPVKDSKEIPVSPSKEVKSPTPQIFSGFKLYKNAEFGFEIQYPVSWNVTEEINENVRGEMVKEFYFKKPNSDLRFAILPRDGLSYGVGAKGTSTPAYIGGSSGVQTQYILKDGRRLWLIFPQYGLYNWLQDLGRLDIMTSAEDVAGDTQIFEKMLSSFKLYK